MTLFPAADANPPRRVSLIKLSGEIARSVATVGRVCVEGEVHQPSRRSGGRGYFTLRDRVAQIPVTFPASRAKRCRTVAGERVQVTGMLEWVNQWGRLQLVADEVVPVGAGAVAAAIAESRARLLADGVLDRPRRLIPRLPAAIGVVCGNEAAVRADIESVIAARFPGYPVDFLEVTVTGAGAAESIAFAIRELDRREEIEVIILARGGGDATHLLPFSDEDVCRAIGNAATPVVSAIGHEGDRPLCDDVADLRCGTPSIAAAAVVPSLVELRGELSRLVTAATHALDRRVESAGRRLVEVDIERVLTARVVQASARLERGGSKLSVLHPGRRAREAAARVARCDYAAPGLAAVTREQARLDAARRELEALSPRRVVERGYAIVRDSRGAVIRSASTTSTGDAVHIELAEGRLLATVDAVEEDNVP